MHYILFSFILWISASAGAFSISFPPHGTPTAALESQMISWTRNQSDPDKFVMHKILLDDGDGPSPTSTPVPIMNSKGSNGTSPFFIHRAGLFQIIAVDTNNKKTFFSTEVTVLTNPTSSLASSGSPEPTGSSNTSNSQSQNSPGSKTSSSQSTNHGKGSQTTPTSPLSTSHSTPSHSPSSTDSNHTKAIIGGVIGGVALLFIVGTSLLCLRYRTRRDTSVFVRAKMHRLHDPDAFDDGDGDQWRASFVLVKNLASSSLKGSSLRPEDSISNIPPPILPPLPPIPAACSGLSDDVLSSVSTSSSIQQKRDRETLRLSMTTTSVSTGTSASLFPIPSIPRTRTDRQMVIEENIQQYQAKILLLQGDSGDVSLMSRLERENELMKINARVDILKKAHESEWALRLTDDVPEGLVFS